MASINVTFSDPFGVYSAQSATFIAALQAAWDSWEFLLGDADVSLEIDMFFYSNPAARADAGSNSFGFLGRLDGYNTWMQGAAYELMTGIDPNGATADIQIRLSIERIPLDIWLNPLDGSLPPEGKGDLVMLLAHELGHALGFNGFREWTTYTIPAMDQSSFDQFMLIEGGAPYFIGPNALALYGGNVPLTIDNKGHVGNLNGPGTDLAGDLMNGVRDFVAYNAGITPLDLAIISDTGLPTILSDRIRGGSNGDRINAQAGNDTVYGAAGNDSIRGGLGDDLIDGGDGDDVAVYAGPSSRYSWTRNSDGSWLVQDTAAVGGEGRDILWDIENLRFANQTITLPASNFTLSLATLNDEMREGSSDGLTSFIFLLRRGGSLASAASYTYTVSGTGPSAASAADFGSGFPTGTVNFGVGQGTVEINVLVRADRIPENDETFQITITGGPVSLQTTAIIHNDDLGVGVQLSGAAGMQTIHGGLGDDTLRGGGGDDTLTGGFGRDLAVYDGAAVNYEWWSPDGGSWRVRDTRAGSPDGTDLLVGVERLQFSDITVEIARLGHATQLGNAFQNLMRHTATTTAEKAFLSNLINAVGFQQLTMAQAYGEIAQRVDGTTAVAAMTYQFFLGFVPSKGGFDFLVSPTGPNPTNINSPYYQFFNQENRYINFAVNVGAGGDGKAAFQAEFGSLTLRQATAKAYAEIFGNTPSQAKLDALLDAPIGGGLTRKDYLAAYGGDGVEGLGTKAAMVGFLLSAAALENQGFYARSTAAYLADLADGAQFLVDIIGTYNQPDWAFGG